MSHIRVGCALIVEHDNKILLGRSNKTAIYGKLVIPGGKVEFGEPHKLAGIREILQETGLVVEVTAPLSVGEIIKPDEHRIVLYYRARLVGGALKPGDDLLDAGFFDKPQVAQHHAANDITPLVSETLQIAGWL